MNICDMWRCNAEAVKDGLCQEHASKPAPCAECTRNAGGMAPTHNGSRNCENGSLANRSIAAGGKTAHCTCARCF